VKAKICLRLSTKWRKKNKYKEKINKDILKTTTAKVYEEKNIDRITRHTRNDELE